MDTQMDTQMDTPPSRSSEAHSSSSLKSMKTLVPEEGFEPS